MLYVSKGLLFHSALFATCNDRQVTKSLGITTAAISSATAATCSLLISMLVQTAFARRGPQFLRNLYKLRLEWLQI